MIRSNKKLYYKYFDLMRVSAFLKEEDIYLRAFSNLSLIKANIETEIVTLSPISLQKVGFDLVTIKEIKEYQETGDIKLIKEYVGQLETWIQDIILSDFFNIEMISNVFIEENIQSNEQLEAFFMSKRSEERFGKEESELFSFYVHSTKWTSFPVKYRTKYTKDDIVIPFVQGRRIWGNFHNHTPYSDGKCTISELKELAKSCGRTYIGISDHTKRVNGVDESAIIKQHSEIEEINSLEHNLVILKGLECEILSNGQLDIPDDYLKRCDYVISAIHSDTCMKKEEATNRLVRAIENPYTNILAHPSSRIYKKKVGLFVDIYKIIDACIANNVAIEINGDADRLDLDPLYIEYALNKGAYFTVDSDTHSFEGFRSINNAIKIAEDKRIPPERILNTFQMERLDYIRLKK